MSSSASVTVWACSRRTSWSSANSSTASERNTAAQLGSSASDQPAGTQVRRQQPGRTVQDLLRRGELAGGEPRQAAAHRFGGQDDPPARVLHDLDRGAADVRVEVVGEGVRPQQHGSASAVAARAAAGEPLLQGLPGEQRDLPVLDARRRHGEAVQHGRVGERVDHLAQPGPADQLRDRGQPAHRQVRPRPPPLPPGVVVGEELGLVGRHVHIGRTVGLASLARQAEVQRVTHLGGAPAAVTGLSSWPRSISNSSRALPRVECSSSPVAWYDGHITCPPSVTCWRQRPTPTHRFAASANEPPSCGYRKCRSCGAAGDQSRPSRRCSSSAVRGDDLARIHQVPRVEDRLELPERAHDLLAEHPRQQLAAGLAVAVLAGQGPAELGDQVRGPLHEPPVVGDALGGVQVERDAGVHAALPEVAVQARPGVAGVAELVVEALEATQVVAELSRARRRSPPSPRRCPAGAGRARWRRGPPRGPATARVRGPGRPGRTPSGSCSVSCSAASIASARLSASSTVSPPNCTIRNARPLGSSASACGLRCLSCSSWISLCVQAFQRDRLVLDDRGHRVGGLGHARVAQHDEGAVLEHGHQLQLRAQDGDQSGLAADEQARHVEAVLGQQGVEVVAGDPARDVGEPGAHLVGVGVAQPAQLPVDRRSAVAAPLDRGVLLVVGRPAPEPGAVVAEHLQRGDVVDHLAGALRGRAAGVVADHAAERAVHVRGGLGTEPQAGRRELAVQLVQHDAGLHHAGAVLRVHGLQFVAVLGPVEHDGGVGALAREARAPAAGEHRRVELPRHRDRLDGRVRGARHHDADRHLAEVRGVGGVGGPAARVEPHLTVHPGPQRRGQRGRVDPAGLPVASRPDHRIGQVRRAHDGTPGSARRVVPTVWSPPVLTATPWPRSANRTADRAWSLRGVTSPMILAWRKRARRKKRRRRRWRR